MRLYANPINDYGTRSWRGRRHNYKVIINEVFNEQLGYVDKYSFSLRKSTVDFEYESPAEFKTIEECKNAALKKVDDHMYLRRMLFKEDKARRFSKGR